MDIHTIFRHIYRCLEDFILIMKMPAALEGEEQ